MKAKPKSRYVAWVVLGAVVALGFGLILGTPLASDLWQWFRYEEVVHPLAAGLQAQLVVLEKRERASWLPGDDYIIPPQVCVHCTMEAHSLCLGGRPKSNRVWFGLESWFVPPFWQCTCPASDHERANR